MLVLNIFVYILNVTIYIYIYIWFCGYSNGSGLFASICPFSCVTSEFLGVSEGRIHGLKIVETPLGKKKTKKDKESDYF